MRMMKKQSKWPILLAGFFVAAMPVAQAGVEISEFMAKNETTLATAAGAYVDWVEIHNDSGSAVDLAGYYLTDDPADLRKWQFPSTENTSSLADDGYLLVFVDDSSDSVIGNELHASFKLGAGGEYLALVEPDGETVVYQYNPEYPDQSEDVSYGIDSGTEEPAYFAVPTPGAPNGQAIADTVQFSVDGGTFTEPFNLILSVASPTAEIHYTTNGTIPTVASSLYNLLIPVDGTIRVRARTFDDDLTDGAIVSRSYIHMDASAAAFTSDLPLIVLENFGAGDVPPSSSPTRQPCEILFFKAKLGSSSFTNSVHIASRAGIRTRGESTHRPTSLKPNLSLETWGEVDEEDRSIKPLGLPAESDWALFAPWDFDRALMRNSFVYELSNEMGYYAPRTRFVEVFLNYDGGSLSASDYYGVYVLMEKIKVGSDRVDIKEMLPADNAEPEITGGYLWKKDKLDDDRTYFTAAGFTDLLSVNPSDTEITATQQQWLVDDINAIDSACENETYETLIDVDSFVNSQMMVVLSQEADGNRLSTFFHKERGGLMKMGPIWDFDRSMGCDNDDRPSDPYEWNNFFFLSNGVMFFKKLSLNAPDFWVAWVDQWKELRDGPGSDTAIDARIEGYRAELATAAIRNFDRWEGYGSYSTNLIPAASEWGGKVDFFKAHVLARVNWIDEQLVEYPDFNQPGGLVPSGVEVSMTSTEAIYYTLDGSDPRASGGSAAGSIYSNPVPIVQNTLVKARCWDGTSFNKAPDTWPWSALTEALFVVDPAPLAITEIMYHPRPPSTPSELVYTASDFEFIEVQNTSASACLLVGVQLLNGVEFDLTEAASDSLDAGQYGVLVRNLEAFKVRYPSWASLNILGTYTGRLSDGGEKMKLGYDVLEMTPLASFDYEDDWFPSTDGEGFSLVLTDSQSDPVSWDSKAAWRHSSGVDGSPGATDPAPAYAPETIVINEVLSHQDQDNPGDWIELHNTTDSAINIGGWFLSDSRGDLKKYAILGGTMIPANGYLVFTEYDHFGSAFALSEHGDAVYLSAGNGVDLSEPAYRESQDFGGQERDVTFGRFIRSDGSANFPSMVSATMGSANSAPRVGPVVIQEIMYHPPVGGVEYVTLRNCSASPIDLYDTANPSNVWKVSGIDFKFPLGTELEAGETVLLVRDTIMPELFRSTYQVPASTDIYNYDGALDNSADTLVLKKPGTPEAQTGYVPLIVVEQVKYNDSAPWPPEADGQGRALERVNPATYANDVANWQAVVASYGPRTYSLVVNSGTGAGVYSEGTAVPIEAATTNLSFVQWIGNVSGVTDVQNSLTSLAMPPQDITVSALYSGPVTFLNAGAEWKYNDLGQDLETAWQVLGYDDSTWAIGAAQLGYDDVGTVTSIDYGGDSDNKYTTTYFRHYFVVDDASLVGDLTLEILRDDGAMVYLNGSEAVRDNMPSGSINYLTFASTRVGSDAENIFYSHPISPTLLVDGTNVIAVEVHQRTLTSSDLSFNARLTGVEATDSAIQDGDVDGMYDAWETNHFGSTEASLPGGDPDEDGFVNRDEFIAGTLPLEPSSFFRINQTQDSDITWATVPGRTYSVYWTDDLEKAFVPIVEDAPDGRFAELYNSTNLTGFIRVKVGMESL